MLPSQDIADGSALSAVGFVGFSGTHDNFDEAVLLGDLDGNLKMENDFDSSSPINALRTSVESQAKVENDVLLPDEVYTAEAISGRSTSFCCRQRSSAPAPSRSSRRESRRRCYASACSAIPC